MLVFGLISFLLFQLPGIENVTDEEVEKIAQGVVHGKYTLLDIFGPDGLGMVSAEYTVAESFVTLEDIDKEIKRKFDDEKTVQIDIPKMLDEIHDLIPMQPPLEPSEYSIALANMMSKSTEVLFSFAQYKGKLPVENLGENIRLGDSEARMASLDLFEDVQSVAEYYFKELTSKGFLPRMQLLYANTLGITFRDTDGFMRGLTLVGFGDQTVVFASVSDARKVYESFLGVNRDAEMKAWEGWAEPRAEQNPIVIRNSDAHMKQTTRTIVVRASSSDEVMNFYTENLIQMGWSMPDVVKREGGGLMSRFEKGLRRCVVSVTPSEDVALFRSVAYCQQAME